MTTLRNVGERQLIDSIVSKYVDGDIGDDCAYLQAGGITLALTTDPVPPPAANGIGGDPSFFWAGWLLVTINASDLAAAAATPLALLVAAEFPDNTSVTEFEDFFRGVSESCKAQGLRYLGGNLKEASRFSATATAIGTSKHTLTRKGARDGDLLVVVGAGGKFWCDALLVKNGGTVEDKYRSPLFAPRSQIHVMRRLVEVLPIHAAMDNSDGLLSSIAQLAKESDVGAVLELDLLHAPVGYSRDRIGMSAERLWLGWGDWNAILAVPKAEEQTIARLIGEGSRSQ